MKKFLLLFFLLSAGILIVFALWGEHFEFLFSGEKGREFFATADQWAGPLGAGLLISDLFLPVPTTVVMGAMGAVMGVVAAAFWGWLGLSLAGLLGYGLARISGRRWGDRLATPEEQTRYRRLFDRWGGLAVVLSRMLPILPEVLSVLAGLYGMRARNFFFAVILGSIPPAIIFAWLGQQAKTHPGPALWALVALTGILWLLYVKVTQTAQEGSAEATEKD
jgi:uncharacterized membrane protein YdjX (TVP38/TMEM64 family)